MTLEAVITVGDPQGIGPEVAFHAARVVAAARSDVGVVLVCDPSMIPGPDMPVAGRGEEPGVRVLPVPMADVPEAPAPCAAAGRAALRWLDAGVQRVLEAPARRALVTAPLSKEAVNLSGTPFTGHTGWLGERCGVRRTAMLFVAGDLRVALATVHVPLRSVADLLQAPELTETLVMLDRGLRELYGIPAPRVAVLGLNPHGGEGGLLGSEEQEVIVPAIAAARERGVLAEGPLGADGYFGALMGADAPPHDGILAMYHDQGLLPVKALAFRQAVNVTLGLPIVRTSVDHGCAFDLAGTGTADHGSMIVALNHALDLLLAADR